MEAGNFFGILLFNYGSNHNWEESLLEGFSVGSHARKWFFGYLAVVTVHRLRVQGELHEGDTALGGVLGGPIKVSQFWLVLLKAGNAVGPFCFGSSTV